MRLRCKTLYLGHGQSEHEAVPPHHLRPSDSQKHAQRIALNNAPEIIQYINTKERSEHSPNSIKSMI